MQIAWGKKVSDLFLLTVRGVASNLEVDPSWIMACMAFETGRTFDPSIRNKAGSGAVGLIQFMPSTALALGTTTERLASMSGPDQLYYVEKYLSSAKQMKSLEDMYMAILWPGAVGKSMDYVLFDRSDEDHPKRYVQNAGLDYNKDGVITKAEASMGALRMLEEGLRAENVVEW